MANNIVIDNFVVRLHGSFIDANIKHLRDVSYQTYVVSNSEAYRADLLSYAIYRTVQLKWLLLYVNSIIDISMLKEGFVLKYPAFSEVIAALTKTLEAKEVA